MSVASGVASALHQQRCSGVASGVAPRAPVVPYRRPGARGALAGRNAVAGLPVALQRNDATQHQWAKIQIEHRGAKLWMRQWPDYSDLTGVDWWQCTLSADWIRGQRGSPRSFRISFSRRLGRFAEGNDMQILDHDGGVDLLAAAERAIRRALAC